MTRTLFPLLAALSLVGCGSSGDIPDQLEAVAVDITPDSDAFDAFNGFTAAGTLEVAGEGRSVALELQAEAVTLDIDLHTPGSVDLQAFSGSVVTLEASESGLHGERNLAIQDEQGVVYLAQAGYRQDLTESLFGAGFASYGAEVGTDRDRQYDWTYTTARFETDDGPVELLPGEKDVIRVGGNAYEVTVVSAYQVEARPRALLPCGGIGDMLSFELVRVEAGEPDFVERPEGAAMAHLGCL